MGHLWRLSNRLMQHSVNTQSIVSTPVAEIRNMIIIWYFAATMGRPPSKI